MKYYTIQNEQILIADNESALTRFYDNVLPLPIDYEPVKYIVVNNELAINPEWDTIQLTKRKEQRIAENNNVRDKKLNSGVTYRNVLFDSDTDQKVNLLATVGMMNDTDVVTWFGMDNVPLECTKEDLINIGGLITQLHTFCWTKNAQIKMLIENASTIEEVEAIEINYEGMG